MKVGDQVQLKEAWRKTLPSEYGGRGVIQVDDQDDELDVEVRFESGAVMWVSPKILENIGENP